MTAKPTAPSPAKPAAKPAAAALPDAALLDGKKDTDEAAPVARTSWLPSGRARWIVLGAAGASVLVLATAVGVGARYLRAAPAPAAPATGVIAGPAQAVDGATVTVAGRSLRLDGIDAPPASLVCTDGSWKYQCGAEARRGLEQAIGGRPIECLAKQPQSGVCRNDLGLDLAAEQVANGWAVVDVRRSSRYIAEQSRAQSELRGLWRNNFADPASWRVAQGDKSAIVVLGNSGRP